MVPPICGQNGLLSLALLKLAPETAQKNVFSIHFRICPSPPRKVPDRCNRRVPRSYRNTHRPRTARAVAAAPYSDFLHLIKKIVESEKSFDPKAIRNALNSTTGYAGLVGTYSFTPAHHTGLSADALCIATILSAKDPKAEWCFRERAPGA